MERVSVKFSLQMVRIIIKGLPTTRKSLTYKMEIVSVLYLLSVFTLTAEISFPEDTQVT